MSHRAVLQLMKLLETSDEKQSCASKKVTASRVDSMRASLREHGLLH
jgi:hypothetical protein